MKTLVLCSAPGAGPSSLKPGGPLPYGIAHLGDRFHVQLVSRPADAAGLDRLWTLAEKAVRHLSPGRRGIVIAERARAPVRTADVVLSVFEDVGLAFARSRRARTRAQTTPHVMMVCWMTEDIRSMGNRAVSSLRRSMASVAAICVYSGNQVRPLADALEVPVERIHVVPFGVDTEYFDSSRVARPAGGGGVVAVGSDSRRDYATLFAAAMATGREVTVACQERNLRGLVVPRNVRIVSAYDAEYRELLHHADLVVTPTVAPDYPSGQSVVLEAMSMGRATVTSDSDAMREYVEPGVTGLLIPPRDADALSSAIERALADPDMRSRIGAAGSTSVRARFSLERQWAAVANILDEVRT